MARTKEKKARFNAFHFNEHEKRIKSVSFCFVDINFFLAKLCLATGSLRPTLEKKQDISKDECSFVKGIFSKEVPRDMKIMEKYGLHYRSIEPFPVLWHCLSDSVMPVPRPAYKPKCLFTMLRCLYSL